jgi:glucose-1-phosphate thymidylyltransferase
MARKGIILAGGAGKRLQPATLVISKQLLPVYDKPMIYYPLSTLMQGDIREILIISTPGDTPRFQQLLGNGSNWGLNLSYAIQARPDGLAQSLIIAEDFLGSDPSALILGDNIFYGHAVGALLERANSRTSGATIFAYHVNDPQRYGVVELDSRGRATGLEEKPIVPRSTLAVTGLYYFDQTAVDRARSLRPSVRGELEITDLNTHYLASDELTVELMDRDCTWLDTGTHDSLLEAGQFIATLERRHGFKVACPEEIAWRKGWISSDELMRLAEGLHGNGYGNYLASLPSQNESLVRD